MSDSTTAHLAAILAEAVARAYERSYFGEDLPLDSESTTHARAAIAVIAARIGVER